MSRLGCDVLFVPPFTLIHFPSTFHSAPSPALVPLPGMGRSSERVAAVKSRPRGRRSALVAGEKQGGASRNVVAGGRATVDFLPVRAVVFVSPDGGRSSRRRPVISSSPARLLFITRRFVV